METITDKPLSVPMPQEIMSIFERSNEFLMRRYDGVAPSPEELIIFYLSGIEPHEVVASLERQVLILSGKMPPDEDEHLLQTYLDMDKKESEVPNE